MLLHTREFEPDDDVLVRNCSGKPKWILDKIIAKTGPVGYEVMVQRLCSSKVQRRHVARST